MQFNLSFGIIINPTMTLNPEWFQRIEHWRKALRELTYTPLGAAPLRGFVTREYLTPEQATSQPMEPFFPGTAWGEAWEYAWFAGQVTLPPAAQNERIVLRLESGGEGLIWVNGQAAGTRDWAHTEITLVQHARPGQSFEILAEMYAGHMSSWFGAGPLLDGRSFIPAPQGTRHVIGESSFGIWNEEIYQLWLDMSALVEVRQKLDPAALRVEQIDRGLKDVTLLVDVELPVAQVRAAAQAGRERLQPLLGCRNGSTAPVLFAFGHAHLDVAWLWPLQETERKTGRTLSNQLALMEEYPEYIYLQSQAQLLQMLKQHYPAIYARLREKARSGQLVVEGGAWVEPDTNVPSAESLIRQFLFGRRFFREEFGVECRLFWEPDVFGYSAAIPQIMLGCGLRYFATQKIMWAYNGGEPFPYNQFQWQGVDGSRVLAHICHGYGYETSPAHLIDAWNGRAQKADAATLMLPFGWGDGGGGPTREHLEFLRRAADLEGAPRVRQASPLSFFEDMEARGIPTAVYVGELYFQAHRGTYTSQARTKRHNRKAEIALREAEMWSALAAAREPGLRSACTKEILASAWQTVLLNQFHDILPGSSIRRVYEEAERSHAESIRAAEEVDAVSRQVLAGAPAPNALTVFNSLSFPRAALVPHPLGAQGLARVQLPACGFLSLDLKETPPQPSLGAARAMQAEDGSFMLENGLLCARFNPYGEVLSLWDKTADREWMAAPGNHLRLFKDIPRQWDAWDVDSAYSEAEVELPAEGQMEVLHSGPWQAVLHWKRRLEHSTFTQEIQLRYDSRRIDFISTVDWQEQHRLLKAAFPVTVHAEEAIYEIQHAHVRRPNHLSRPYDADRFEVPLQRWMALAEEGRGAALLNDCKYGGNTLGNTMQISLLRAPVAPDPQADRGEQHFTYALYVWNGSLLDSGIVQQAYDLNVPPQVVPAHADLEGTSFFRLDAPNVFLDVVKTAEDGSGNLVLRLFEGLRTATRCVLFTAGFEVARAWETNMLEDHLRELPCMDGQIELDFRPFEIKTIVLEFNQRLLDEIRNKAILQKN
jgi:alpha-mannosidase